MTGKDDAFEIGLQYSKRRGNIVYHVGILSLSLSSDKVFIQYFKNEKEKALQSKN